MSKNKFEVIITETDEDINLKLIDYENSSTTGLSLEEIKGSAMAMMAKLLLGKFKESYKTVFNKEEQAETKPNLPF